MMETNNALVGIGWGFPPSFDLSTRTLVMVSDASDVEQSLRILFSTMKGERIMNPQFGCDIQKFLFNPIDLTVETQLKDLLSDAVLNYEPRITINSLSIDGQNYLDGVLTVTLEYTVKQTNSRHNMVYPFYLAEGTNLDL